MIIVGIDIGTACGWAVRYDAKRMDSGVWDLSLGRYDGAGMRPLRLRRFLNELIDGHTPDLVAYEEVRRHLGTGAAHVYGELAGVIRAECELRKIAYTGIPIATIKKRATGSGNAKKEKMVLACTREWGVQVVDDNEADARWCAEVAADSWMGDA